jgi:hypothetical protein
MKGRTTCSSVRIVWKKRTKSNHLVNFHDLSGGELLGGEDGDDIGQVVAGAADTFGVLGKHDLDLDADGASTEVAVAGGLVDELLVGGTGLDHVAVTEDHGLGTLTLDLATDADLAALGTRLHDEADDAGRGTADLEVAEELEAEGLSLGHGGEATGANTLNVERNAALGVLEALLDASGELANTASLLTQDLLGLGGADHDLSAAGGDAGLDASEAILSELTLEELRELSVEHTIAHELSLLGEDADHRDEA